MNFSGIGCEFVLDENFTDLPKTHDKGRFLVSFTRPRVRIHITKEGKQMSMTKKRIEGLMNPAREMEHGTR